MAFPPSTSCDPLVVGCLHLTNAFASWGTMKRRHDDPYSSSFSAAMASASHVPAVEQIGHEHWPT
jgi:hypothetical protein